MLRRYHLAVLLLLALISVLFAQERQTEVGQAQQSNTSVFQPDQRAFWENFLHTAQVVKTRRIPTGITHPVRVTLTDGTVTHDAIFKTIDEFKRGITQMQAGVEIDLKDSYKFEIAAYELDKILQINMIFPTVARTINQEKGSIQYWIDNAQSELDRFKNKIEPPNPEIWNRQMYTVRLFDALIYNWDRNLGNLKVTKDTRFWNLWMIDHSRSFKVLSTIINAKDIEKSKIPRTVWERMQALDFATLNERLKPYLTETEIKAILKRRDALAIQIRKLEAEKGDALFF